MQGRDGAWDVRLRKILWLTTDLMIYPEFSLGGPTFGESCGTLITLCPWHSTLLSLSHNAHKVSKMSLFCFLLGLGLPRGLGSPLSSLGSHSPPGMFLFSFLEWVLLRPVSSWYTSFSEWVLLGQVSPWNTSFLEGVLLRPASPWNRYQHSPNDPQCLWAESSSPVLSRTSVHR